MQIKTLDISKHQMVFRPDVAVANGVDATIIRNAYAGGKDAVATSWADSIRKTKMPLGGYGFATWHYASANGRNVSKAREVMLYQVKRWIEINQAVNDNWWFAIDQELEKDESMGLDMMSNTQLLNEAARLLMDAGYKVLIYCSIAWDYSYIHTKTLDPDIKYWFAYYPTAIKGKDFDQAVFDNVPAGKYKNWLVACYDSGRLAGWQYGSTGYGAKYGCGSSNVDRSIFYQHPADMKPTVPMSIIHTGPMTDGDIEATKNFLDARQIAYEVEKWK